MVAIFISYLVFVVALLEFFPEVWLLDIFREDYYHYLILEGKWNKVFMSLILLLALIINIGFIFLVGAVIKKTASKSIFSGV